MIRYLHKYSAELTASMDPDVKTGTNNFVAGAGAGEICDAEVGSIYLIS